MSNARIKWITVTGVCIALTVLLTYVFSIRTTFIHITFGFLPIALYGTLYSPVRTGCMAAIATLIGMATFGQDAFFVGFMVSDFLTGFIFSYFFYQKKLSWIRIAIPFLLVMIVVHLGLNTLWLTLFYNKAASAIFMSRLIKNILCYPMEITLFWMLERALRKPLRWHCSPHA